MSFNTVQYDSETMKRMQSYQGQMKRFSRFELKLLCKANDIQCKENDAPDHLINLLANDDVSVPTSQELEGIKIQYRKSLKEASEKKEEKIIKEKKQEAVDAVIDEGDGLVSLADDGIKIGGVFVDDMQRSELMKAAAKVGVKGMISMKNDVLARKIKEAILDAENSAEHG